MTELDQAIVAAYASQGKQEDVNKVYLTFLRSMIYIPVKKDHPATEEEPFSPLFAKVDNNYFIMAFDTLEKLRGWAGDHAAELDYVGLLGADLMKGISEQVFLCLNFGTESYKEFSPDELKHLKKIVARIQQLKE